MPARAAMLRWMPGAAPEALSEALFDGALVVFGQLPSVAQLGDRVRATLAATFAADDPRRAEVDLSAAVFRRLALRARRRVAGDARVAALWRETHTALGFAADAMWLDRVRLRVVPSRRDIGHRRLQALPPHRDTWASGIAAQVNWWLPLYPLAEAHTMRVWPESFRQPIANDSDGWRVETAGPGGTLLPTAQVPPQGAGRPVMLEPGELLAFSAAHLHGGVADSSGLTRFGMDTRTVWEADRVAGRGAPNVDGPPSSPSRQMWRWFTPPQRCAA